jgi:hypothetical protein
MRRCGVVNIAEKTRKARLRWCGHVTRRDKGELVERLGNGEIRRSEVMDIAKKARKARLTWCGHVMRRG